MLAGQSWFKPNIKMMCKIQLISFCFFHFGQVQRFIAGFSFHLLRLLTCGPAAENVGLVMQSPMFRHSVSGSFFTQVFGLWTLKLFCDRNNSLKTKKSKQNEKQNINSETSFDSIEREEFDWFFYFI